MNLRWSSSIYKIGLPFGVAIALALMSVMSSAINRSPKAWVDASNGYAIGGYDPVDYFVRGEAVHPSTDIETYWGGVSWKFRNVGNRAAFLAHPRTYVPRFGGTDPFLLAKGRAVQGNPTLFDIHDDRLYLFYSGLTLSSWKQKRTAFIANANKAWPGAARTLGLDPAEPVNPSDIPAWDR